MPDIMHLIRFISEPQQVYAAITSADGVRAWWTKDADLESMPGGMGAFRFYGDKVTRVRVEEVRPPGLVVWQVEDSFRPEWLGTRISFEIRQEDGGSSLLFRHQGFPRADEDYALCTTGWGIYLDRLRTYVDANTASNAAG